MGSGASVGTDRQREHVSVLLRTVQSTATASATERQAALVELADLCDDDDYKGPLVSHGLLTILEQVLEEETPDGGNVITAKTQAVKCLFCLSKTYDIKYTLISHKNMMSALVDVIKRDRHDARRMALSCCVYCASDPASLEYLLNPTVGLLQVLALLIATDTDEANVYQTYKLLANLLRNDLSAEHVTAMIQVYGFHFSAVRLLMDLGPDPREWPSRQAAPEMCRFVLLYMSAHPVSAASLRAVGAVELATALVATPEREAIGSALILAFLTGNQEPTRSKQALLCEYPHVADMLVDLLEAQLSGGAGPAFDRLTARGYLYHWYRIALVVQGIRVLSMSDGNKAVLMQTRLLTLLVVVLRRFHENLPPVAREFKQGQSTIVEFVGGGGEDEEAAAAAVETCLRLSFILENEADFMAKFAAPELGLTALLEDVLELAAPRQLGEEARQAARLLLGRLRDADDAACSKGDDADAPANADAGAMAPKLTSPSPQPGPPQGPAPQHVMLSYAWAAKKDLVVALGAALAGLGYDVWRDEEGSDVVPPMSGDTDDRMAEAIEASHAVVICVSPQYKESFNCRSEAKYCQTMKKNHGLKLLYVMVDDGYTTVSKGRTVDGWLGFMVGGELWYPLWSADKVAGTAAELAKAIGNNARSQMRGRLYEAPRPKETESGGAAAAHMASDTSTKHVNAAPSSSAVNAAAAWGLVQDPTKIKDASRLARMLAEHGVSEAEDLAVLADDRALCESLAGCLKTAPAKRVLLLLGLG